MSDKLREAFKEYNEHLCRTLPQEQELQEITFSNRFLRKMERRINQHNRLYYPLINTMTRRVALGFIIGIFAVTAIFVGIRFAQEPIMYYLMPSDKQIEEILPQYIPEEFSLVEEKKEKTNIQHVYKTKDDRALIITQQWLSESDLNDQFKIYEKEEKLHLMVVIEEYKFTISGSKPMAEAEIIKIAKSIKK